jgi:thiamine biosynthesis lipoprotein
MLRITATAGGAGIASAFLPAALSATTASPQRWRGTALGARASMTLYHPDPAEGRRLIAAAIAEVRRLEQIFSLYRPDSALSALNRQGALDAPPMELVRLLSEAQRYGAMTGGAFDVTVQPLWTLYADHFARENADPAGPSAAAIRDALARVDYRGLALEPQRISFARPGMAATLNGIAQGFITDRVADLLRANGLENVLIDLGETRGLGSRPDGRPWRAGLKDPFAPGRVARTVEIGNHALATSGGYGMRFDADGRHHHLFDPRRGRSSDLYASVSVIAPTATEADALSTAFASMRPDERAALAGRLPAVTAFVTRQNGDTTIWRGRAV